MTGVPGPPPSRLFFVTDPKMHTRYLVDTGSEVSTIPPYPADRRRSPDKLTLMAVSDTPIHTYGKRSLTLDFGLRRLLPWIFVIADVQKPILGADFLRHFGLWVDMQQRQLIDSQTQLHIQGVISTTPSPSPSICPKDTNNPYLTLLSEFPALTQVCSLDTPIKHDVTHCPATDHFRAAKQEFDSSSASYDPPPVPSLHSYTWSPRKMLGLASLWRLPCSQSDYC